MTVVTGDEMLSSKVAVAQPTSCRLEVLGHARVVCRPAHPRNAMDGAVQLGGFLSFFFFLFSFSFVPWLCSQRELGQESKYTGVRCGID